MTVMIFSEIKENIEGMESILNNDCSSSSIRKVASLHNSNILAIACIYKKSLEEKDINSISECFKYIFLQMDIEYKILNKIESISDDMDSVYDMTKYTNETAYICNIIKKSDKFVIGRNL